MRSETNSDRVHRLERAVLRQRVLNVIVLVALLASAAEGPLRVQDEVFAKRFVVRGEDGKMLGEFGINPEYQRSARLELLSPDGTSASIGVRDGNASLLMRTGEWESQVSLTVQEAESDTRSAMIMKSNGAGQMLFMVGGDMPSIILDHDQINRISIGPSFYGEDGKVAGFFVEPKITEGPRTSGGLYMDEDGRVTLRVLGPDGKAPMDITTERER